MSAILTKSFRLQQAELFKQFFQVSGSKNMYVGVGKSLPWTDELNPPIPLDTVTEYTDVHDTLIGLKKVSVTDITNVIPRFDWTNNTTRFVAYSNLDPDLFNHPTSAEVSAAALGGYTAGSFYVMTDEYNVYKCLKAPAVKSTVKPTGKLLVPFETADGYVWKYMYTVSGADIDKYLTNAWLPVKTLLSDDGSDQWDVQQSAIAGTINNIRIDNDGSGYTLAATGTAQAGSASSITLAASHGSTNFIGETVHILTGPGAGEFFRISAYNTGTKVATIAGTWTVNPTNASTYEIIPTIIVDGNGSGFKARVKIVGDNITDTYVQNPGSGYTYANLTLSSGTGYSLKASISPADGHGSDPVAEFGGSYIMVSTQLEYSDPNLINDNDYRRIVLLQDVLDDTAAIASAPSLNALKSIDISNISGTFVRDEIVQTSGGARFAIVSIDTVNDKIYYIQNSTTGTNTFTSSETITGLTSGATADIDTLNNSDITNGSGNIFYIKHLRPLLRSPSLNEDIRLLIQF